MPFFCATIPEFNVDGGIRVCGGRLRRFVEGGTYRRCRCRVPFEATVLYIVRMYNN